MPTHKRLGLVIDLQRCIGCWTCAVACKADNSVGLGNWWIKVLSNGQQEQFGMPATAPNGQPQLFFRPYTCMHCQNAPCVKSCPIGATYKRPDGITAQDYSKCIGCRMCLVACPYQVRVFNWSKPVQVPEFDDDHVGNADVPARPQGVVEKCTFCAERIDKGELPACVAGCPAHALTIGDLNDPNSEVSERISLCGGETYKDELGTKPSVYYLPWRNRLLAKNKTMSKSAGTTVSKTASTTASYHNTGTAVEVPDQSVLRDKGGCCLNPAEEINNTPKGGQKL